MRIGSATRYLLLLPLLFTLQAPAEEITDRAAIAGVIAALNQIPLRPELFTADSDAPAVIRELLRGVVIVNRDQVPTVTISHEPWGEATLNFPPQNSLPSEMLHPRFVPGVINFTTPHAALARGSCVYLNESPVRTTPLAFVMKKQGNVWKIASLLVLAPDQSQSRLH